MVAAMNWLKTQPEVDANRILVSGCSFGGIQTLLTAKKGLGARAFIAFAPAAQSWGNGALDERLEDAVKHAKAPVFILQAKNDYSIQPTQVLGKIAKADGGQARIYPAFGNTPQDAHWDFCNNRRWDRPLGGGCAAVYRRSIAVTVPPIKQIDGPLFLPLFPYCRSYGQNALNES